MRALNDLRKAIGLELSDRITVELRAGGDVAEAARRHGDWIAGEVLALQWHVDGDAPPGEDGDAGYTAVTVDGAPVGLRVQLA